MNFYNLTNEVLVGHAHNVEHVRVAHPFRNDERTRHLYDTALGHILNHLLSNI